MRIKFQFIYFDSVNDDVVIVIDNKGEEHRFEFNEIPMSLKIMLILQKVMNGEVVPIKYKLFEERIKELLPVEWELINGQLYDTNNEVVRRHNAKYGVDSGWVFGSSNQTTIQ